MAKKNVSVLHYTCDMCNSGEFVEIDPDRTIISEAQHLPEGWLLKRNPPGKTPTLLHYCGVCRKKLEPKRFMMNGTITIDVEIGVEATTREEAYENLRVKALDSLLMWDQETVKKYKLDPSMNDVDWTYFDMEVE